MSLTGWDAPCSAALGFLPGRSQRVRHRRGRSCLTAQSPSAHQKSQIEVFKNTSQRAKSASCSARGSFLAGRTGPGVPSCSGDGFWVCLTPFQHNRVGTPDPAPPNPLSKVVLLTNIINHLRKHLFCQVSNYFAHFIYLSIIYKGKKILFMHSIEIGNEREKCRKIRMLCLSH